MEYQPDDLSELLVRIQSGDEAALQSLYETTVHRVFALAIKIVRRSGLAEEVVSDVFLQVWRRAGDYDAQRAVPMAWLLMICRSRALDRLRKEKSATRNQYQRDEHAQVEDTEAVSVVEAISHGELSERVSAALAVLNEKQRIMITLAFYQGMSHQEICTYTGEPLGTVKSNLNRAQAILKRTLAREDVVKGEMYGEA